MRASLSVGWTIAVGAILSGRTLSAQETRFSPTLRVGQQLDIATIDGDVIVRQGAGRTAEVVATKRVRRGDASRVKAVMEQTSNGYRVCTIYLHRGEDDRDTCRGESHGRSRRDWDDNNGYDIEMSYDVTLPAGVSIAVNTVDGNIEVRGVDTPATIHSVDGNITYEGVAPNNLNTVDGDIRATILPGAWSADALMRTVDGTIEVFLPSDVAIDVRGSTVDGSFRSDFPMTMRDKWGPRSFTGTIGTGGARLLRLSSVDGDIMLRRR